MKMLKYDPDVIAVFLFDDGGKLDLLKLNKNLRYDVHGCDDITMDTSEFGCPDEVAS